VDETSLEGGGLQNLVGADRNKRFIETFVTNHWQVRIFLAPRPDI
jgi:hypothetical protein